MAKVWRTKDTQDIGWSQLISDAKTQIQGSQRTIARLKKSIRFFQKQEASGKPFPVSKK
jgi:hypothetical protein